MQPITTSFYFINTSSSDRDLTYAFVGIIVNMMSDPEQRPQFQQQVSYFDIQDNMENQTNIKKQCLLANKQYYTINFRVEFKDVSESLKPVSTSKTGPWHVQFVKRYGTIALIQTISQNQQQTKIAYVILKVNCILTIQPIHS